MSLLAQGAEAILERHADTVIKRRPAKGYRIDAIDSALRKSRQRREQKVMAKLLAAGVPVPKVMATDELHMTMTMEFLDGPKVRDVIDKDAQRYAAALGSLLARMHKQGIAHGDPTTSNFIVKHGVVHVIDFGLSVFTKKTEDYAVDLHLLHQVFTGTHTTVAEEAWSVARDAYVREWPEGNRILDWLDKRVEKRGRNKRRQ
jgi:TP53 regulating kinase-like protein